MSAYRLTGLDVAFFCLCAAGCWLLWQLLDLVMDYAWVQGFIEGRLHR